MVDSKHGQNSRCRWLGLLSLRLLAVNGYTLQGNGAVSEVEEVSTVII